MIKFFSSFLLVSLLQLNLLASSADSTANSSTPDSTKYWTFKSLSLLSVSQSAFVNWSAGGESSLTGKASVVYSAKYKKNNFSLEQLGDLEFGMVGYMDHRVEKTNDKLNLSFIISNQSNDKWSLTNLITLKSQFANGYKYPNDSTLISSFFAPAYITVSLGYNYKPNIKFQIFLSPASGKMTFVLVDELANKGAFGVRKAVIDSVGNVITPGSHFLAVIGFTIVTSYSSEIMKNIKLNSALTLHNNYFDFNRNNRWNVDVDFDSRVIFSINNLFATVLYVHLIYDDNVMFPNYQTIDGKEVVVSQSPRLQVNESFGLGLTYKIN